MPGLRTAIVHEWIDSYAGSEQVFEAIARQFPQADLYALSHSPGVNLDLGGRQVRTTVLDRKILRDRRSLTLPFMPLAWRRLGVGNYELVITSHHAFAHSNILSQPSGIHLGYVHSPARYLWAPEIDNRGSAAILSPARAVLKRADLRATQNVHSYAANSKAVADRIMEYWGRPARIIHPPVRVEYFRAASGESNRQLRGYVLGVGRWIPYKNLHLVIDAASLAGVPVKVAGRGPDKSRILAAAAKARVPVEIIENPSDQTLRELYAGAICLIFPTVEDFGIIPVEAQAAGTPVVAPASGGALETVVHGRTGFLTDEVSPPALADGIHQVMNLRPGDCVLNAGRFSGSHFAENISDWVRSMSCTQE